MMVARTSLCYILKERKTEKEKSLKDGKPFINNKKKTCVSITFQEIYFLVFCISGLFVNFQTVYVFILVRAYVPHFMG